jgi:RNA polymerase sporulation-specific sigma factor
MAFRARRKTAGDVSLSEALDTDEDGGGLRIMDVIASEDDLADQIGSRELCRSLRENIDRCLDEREAKIIRLRYGLDGANPLTQLETAEVCKISRSYVSRLEKRALEKLRAAMEGPAL